MTNEQFYDIFDQELHNLVEANPVLKTIHKNLNNQKAYALLYWFLEFYGQVQGFEDYIVDGGNDNSCDIIYDQKNAEGEKIYYLIQSKWRNENNFQKPLDEETFKKTLLDFGNILKGTDLDFAHSNEKFKKKYAQMISDRDNNRAKIKCIFFGLFSYTNPIFEKEIKLFSHEIKVIGIEQIKETYIEIKYKNIFYTHLLEEQRKADEVDIRLPIEPVEHELIPFFTVHSPSKASITLIKPKTVFDLFEKYRFSLFHRNIRNPLPESNYNPLIAKTLLERPDKFWYFNNGMVARTDKLLVRDKQTKIFNLNGLQIINGAQTFFTVYQTYKEANTRIRKKLDESVRISIKIIETTDEEFSKDITRYTNSQNPLIARDFRANENEQIILQKESFATNFWYEKRRGEFPNPQLLPANIRILSNDDLAQKYLAYHLAMPYEAIRHTEYFFTSNKDHKFGLYETIFNKTTQFKNFLACETLFGIFEEAISYNSFVAETWGYENSTTIKELIPLTDRKEIRHFILAAMYLFRLFHTFILNQSKREQFGYGLLEENTLLVKQVIVFLILWLKNSEKFSFTEFITLPHENYLLDLSAQIEEKQHFFEELRSFQIY